MQDEVTQADREAAASIAVLVEMRELILSGRADHHAEPFARHRHQAERDTLARMEPVAWSYTSENGKKHVTSFEQWAPHIVAEIGATEVALYALPPALEAEE